MQTKFATIGSLVLAFGLSSCLQSEQKAIVNPDGSCSFTVENTMNVSAMKGMAGMMLPGATASGAKEDPAKSAQESKDMLLGILGKAKGVDVWTDATTRVDPKGNMVAKLSGYAKDVTKLQLMSEASEAGGGDGPKMDGIASFVTSKDADGNLVLEVPVEKMISESSKKDADSGATTTPEERKAKRQEQKQQSAMMMGMMGAMLKDAKISYLFNFGQGIVVEHGCFKLVNPHTVSLEVKLLDTILAVQKMADDDSIAAAIEGGKSFDPKNPEHQKILALMTESIYGKGGKPRVVVKTQGQAFDYAAAVTKAKGAQSAELKAMIVEAEKNAKEPKLNMLEPIGSSTPVK